MNRFIGAIVVFALLAMGGGCSESGKTQAPAPVVPDVRIFYPVTDENHPIADSTEIYVGVGTTSAAVSQVEFLFARRTKILPDTIGFESEPIDTSLVPQAIKPYFRTFPSNWKLYKRWWYPGPRYRPPKGTYVASGEHVQLFALAMEADGGEGRSEFTQVRVLNQGDPLHPPIPCFLSDPLQGRINDVITFDPACTTDNLDTNDLISVRWDFDGDPSNGWDIDWNRDARADQKKTWTFNAPHTYNVIMEAHNTYLPDEITRYERPLLITNARGNPNPPDPLDYAPIPAGTFTVGATTYILDDTTRTADVNESPVHQVVLSKPFLISKYEITNALYLQYLAAAQAKTPPAIVYDHASQEVRYSNLDGVVDTLWVYLRLDPAVTKIYFDLDSNSFKVASGYENHPVTGVSWHGADAYCAFYGLRLPTEAEWEVAARGSHTDYAFPFGATLTLADGGRRATYRDCRGNSDPFPETGQHAGTTPVGFFNGQLYEGFQTIDSPSVYGLYDMAGNVSEFTADWFSGYKSGTENDPQGPISGTYKVVRGGNYQLSRDGIRCTARGGEENLDQSFATIGFRPAYTQFQ
jgi:formylglycine-generating enzyme required for sulfatase activity